MTITAADISSAVPHLLPPPAPLDGFAPEEFRARRNALRAACPDGIVVVRGTTDSEAAHASAHRQNSPFYYLTGVSTPNAFLVLLPHGVSASLGLKGVPAETREILFLPTRNAATETWLGARLGPGEETEAATGIAKVVDAGRFWSALTAWLHHNALVYTFTPYGEQAKLTREYAFMQRVGDYAPVVQFRDIAKPLTALRMIKSTAEIARIEEAIAITGEGHRAARNLIAAGAGRNEYEVEAAIFAAFRSRGARPGFATIVGGGANATVLHYEDNNQILRQGDAVVIDIGAQIGGYNGDVTRTYPVGGVFSPRQRDLYRLVQSAIETSVTAFVTGVDSQNSMDTRCKELLKASLLRARDRNGAETDKTLDGYMPHGLSHNLGLDVHDLIQVVDRDAPLLPGQVVTIEPGVYIPVEGIGVRLENDYLVTENGLRRLGPDLESDLDAVERAMMASGS